MPSRTTRSDAQIQSLAAELSRTWVAGNGVKPWLRRQAPRLSRLVRLEGWSWDDVGRAMMAAGISYATGRPWTGAVLARKASEARIELCAHDERQRKASGRKRGVAVADAGQAKEAAAAAEPATPSVQAAVPAPATGGAEPLHRTFRLARPRGWMPGATPTAAEPEPPASPATAPAVDVDAVIARFLGRPDPSTSSKDGN